MPRPAPKLVRLPAVLALLALAAMAIDMPVARWVEAERYPGELKHFLDLCEAFAHGYGVAVILIAVLTLDISARSHLAKIVAATACVGISSNLLKLVIARTRPHHFDMARGAAESFGAWFPSPALGSGQQSFPSGHAALAAALAMTLTWLYPRGRYLFATLAALAACQRVVAGAHYPSDVLAGAAFGTLVSGLILRWPHSMRQTAKSIARGDTPTVE